MDLVDRSAVSRDNDLFRANLLASAEREVAPRGYLSVHPALGGARVHCHDNRSRRVPCSQLGGGIGGFAEAFRIDKYHEVQDPGAYHRVGGIGRSLAPHLAEFAVDRARVDSSWGLNIELVLHCFALKPLCPIREGI